MVLLEPESLSHACSALSVIWLGKPDAAPRIMMASIFGLASTSRRRGLGTAGGAAASAPPGAAWSVPITLTESIS